ncbi:hypothetical protein [Nonomuraea sp. NPDC050783]|uniref:hypothetical protein n=1 Tax=Nonomuraea sp. NPDC050783 TaxID=3154634 RepID=UPI0034679F51
MVRLAYGVTTGRGQQVRDASGQAVAEPSPGRPGAPVAVGPADADPRPAVAELNRLLAADGGDVAAGAGIELGGGFVSARLEGAPGDRRDAVLVALRVLGLDGLARLGERAGVLVALFGVEATRRVGAAAGRAIAEERWAALQLASAASALLGAEQLEHVLDLGRAAPSPAVGPGSRPAASPVAPEPHAMPSALADHLRRILGPLPRHRRLPLLLDLWQQVADRQEAARRTRRHLATQGRQNRLEELRRRYLAHEDDLVVRALRASVGHEPTLADAARWRPPTWYHTRLMTRAMHNAMAATVLLRTAVAVADHGVTEGLARCAGPIRAAAALMDDGEAGEAARRVPGLTGLPARPGCYVRNLAARLDAPPEQYVRQRLARASEYARVVLEAISDMVYDVADDLRDWSPAELRDWRAAAGYTPERPPAIWSQPPLAGEGRPPLSDRLAARPGVPPEEVETAGDLLWYAELADALLQLHGGVRAEVTFQHPFPYVNWWAPDQDEGPAPGLDTISSALAGAAQLVSLGARPSPRRCASWPDLVGGLSAELETAQGLMAAFPVPEPLAAADGTTIPGTDLRVECARDPRVLAGWSSYMGNCIAGPDYVEEAAKGECALLALRGPDGLVVANAEIRPRRLGWQIAELKARFNAEPDPELRERLTRWVAALPVPRPAGPEPEPEPDASELSVRGRPPGRRGPRRAGRVFGELRAPLAELAGRALARPAAVAALDTLRALDAARRLTPSRTLSRTSAGSARPVRDEGLDVLTALRRLPYPSGMERACLAALPVTGLPALWQATGVRPLALALEALDPELRARLGDLDPLLADAPLPGRLRELARYGAIAPARSMELVARRVRAALGRLARAADPALARQIARHPDRDALCALVIAVTGRPPAEPMSPITASGEHAVPGRPRSDLDDPAGPWRRALLGAVELGADLDAFRDRVAEGGLRVPVSWLGDGGWPALWQRACRPHRAAPPPRPDP